MSDAECSPLTGLCTCGRGLFAAGSECKPLIDAGGWSVTLFKPCGFGRCHISKVIEEEKEAKYEKHSAKRMGASVSLCVCVCVRERDTQTQTDRQTETERQTDRDRETDRQCVCVCVRERERERRVCVCVCVCVYVCVCV